MEVYDKNYLIYSIKLNIEGIYYCYGSTNFEINKINKEIIIDYDVIHSIYEELEINYRNYD
jgi:hypothetical protein